MNHDSDSIQSLSRISCVVYHQLTPGVIRCLKEYGLSPVMAESGRSVRYRRKRSKMRFRRQIIRTEDSPVDIFRVDVPAALSTTVQKAIIKTANLDRSGRGSIFSQNVEEYIPRDFPQQFSIPIEDTKDTAADYSPEYRPDLLHDLALITFILSADGSGERLAELALELGTGVPILTAGTGTGMRDRLGLLRITVPPEKGLMHILVPAHDAEGLLRQLVEEGRLNGPGRGFVYYTTVQSGLLDTRLLIGPQEQAASMEQVVAALDKLCSGTDWRRRFASENTASGFRLLKNLNEISFVCDEERTGRFVQAALEAGASGATKARIKRLNLEESGGGNAARERCVLTVAQNTSDQVVKAILESRKEHPQWLDSLQVLRAPAAYSYQSRKI